MNEDEEKSHIRSGNCFFLSLTPTTEEKNPGWEKWDRLNGRKRSKQ